MKRNYFFALLISATMLFAACSEDETEDALGDQENTEQTTPEDNSDAVVPTAIELSDSAKELEVNEIYTLTATLTPADAEGTITWESSDTAVATVSSKGVVMALALGNTTITATCDELSASCAVSVVEEVVEPEPEVDGDNILLYAYGYGPEDGTSEYVDFADNDGIYALTNSVIQANNYDTQFCIVFGSLVETATVDDEADTEAEYVGIEAGYIYYVSMMVMTVGDSVGLWPGISSDTSDYLGAPEPNAWMATTSDWSEYAFTMTTLGFEDSDLTGGNKISFSVGDVLTTIYIKDITITKVEQ